MNRKLLREVVIETGLTLGADVLQRLLDVRATSRSRYYLIRTSDVEVLGPFLTTAEQEAAALALGQGERLLAARVDGNRLVVTLFCEGEPDWDDTGPY